MNRILHHAATALILALAAVAAWASVRTGLFAQPLWPPDDIPVLVLLGVVVAGGVAALRWWRWPRARLAAVVLLAAAAAVAGVGAATTVVLVLVSAFCLGRRGLPADALEGDGATEAAVLAIALGLAGLVLAVTVLSFFPVANPATYLALLVAPIAWGGADHRRALAALWARARTPAGERPWSVDALAVAIGLALLLQALAVLQPELGYDALHMHLAIADQLQAHGRFDYDVGHFAWAVMPMAGDWLFGLGHVLAGEPAARLLNFAAGLLLLALLHAYVARRAGSFAAALAVALYALTPLLYLEAATLLVENAWTLWLVAALAAGARTLDDDDPRWVAASGALLGTAFAAKVMTAFALPFFVALAIAWMLRRRPRIVRDLALAAGTIAAFGALPYVNAWVRTGNPVFPFFNHWFRSPLYPAEAFNNVLYNQPLGPDLLYAMTFDTGHYMEAQPGALGLWWLVLWPAAALLAWRTGRRHAVAFVLALGFVLAVFRFQTYLRYVLPMLAVFAALAALALERWREGRVERALLGALLAAGAVANLALYATASWDYKDLRLPTFATAGARADYMRGRVDEQLAPAVLDALDLRRALWLGFPRMAGSRAHLETIGWTAPANNASYLAIATADDARRWIAARQFEAIVLASAAEPCQRPAFCDFLARDTDVVFESGELRVHRVHADVLMTTELVRNPNFVAGRQAWDGEGTVSAGVASVDVDRTLYQAVAVQAGRRYRLVVSGRCAPGFPDAHLRLQVNWVGADFTTVGTSYRVVACNAAAEVTAIVRAPDGSTGAVVYASGHDPGKPVEFDRVSLLQ